MACAIRAFRSPQRPAARQRRSPRLSFPSALTGACPFYFTKFPSSINSRAPARHITPLPAETGSPHIPIVRLSDSRHIISQIANNYYPTTYTFNRTKSDNYLTLYFVEGPSPYFSDRPNFTIRSKSFWMVPFEGFFSNTSI